MVPRQRLPQQQQQQPTMVLVIDDSQQPLLDQDEPSLRSNSFSDSTVSSTASSAAPPPPVKEQRDPAEAARLHHDCFNLFMLVLVVATTVVNWDFSMLLQGYSPLQCWTGQHFYLNWMTTFVYFLADLVWVAVVPVCVKSPEIIIKHHAIAMIYLFGPMAWPKYRWAMGACLSVEINTWFLILRRLLFKHQELFPFVAVALWQRIVSICFYSSWIIIRCIVYPGVMYQYLVFAHEAIAESNQWFHPPMLCIPVHFALCILNLKWTYDLFQPMVRNWWTGQGGVGVASGL